MFKEKYLKYKTKYTELKRQHGGLISVPESKINLKINNRAIPEKISYLVKQITIPNTNIIRVGSSINKIQPFFSDVDIMNIVNLKLNKNESIKYFIDKLKDIILNIKSLPNTFFSDFKAGGFHWNEKEILNEINNSASISLEEACKIKDVIKLDIIAPYNERYIEMSTFFVLQSTDGFINIKDDYFNDLEKSLYKDIEEYKNIKPFKAIKRVWSLLSLTNNLKVLIKLETLIKSNVALLSQINADIETLELLLTHKNNYNLDFVITELNLMKEHISHIIDIDFDDAKVILMIDNIILLFRILNNNDNENDKGYLLESLKMLHDYLLGIINNETNAYLKSIDFSFDRI